MNKKLIFITLLLCLSFVFSPVYAEEELSIDDGYFTLFNEEGEKLLATANVLSIGDIFISPDNISYLITSITDNNAYAKSE